jgi:hypothetical protein
MYVCECECMKRKRLKCARQYWQPVLRRAIICRRQRARIALCVCGLLIKSLLRNLFSPAEAERIGMGLCFVLAVFGFVSSGGLRADNQSRVHQDAADSA